MHAEKRVLDPAQPMTDLIGAHDSRLAQYLGLRPTRVEIVTMMVHILIDGLPLISAGQECRRWRHVFWQQARY